MATQPKQMSQRDRDKMTIFDLIKLDPKYARTRSIDWYKKKINELGGNGPLTKTELLNTTKSLQTTRMLPGAMYFYAYDPKHKDTLPHYDMFPLTFVISMEAEYFTGLNFHYLGYEMRRRLYEKMYLIGHKSKLPTEQVMKLNWDLLKQVSRFPEVRPTIHNYLYSHVKSRFIKIPVDDWATAIMLPVEKFAKRQSDVVQRISTRKITGR